MFGNYVSKRLKVLPFFLPARRGYAQAGTKLWYFNEVPRALPVGLHFEPAQHTWLPLGIFPCNSKVYPPDNIGMMTIEFPFSIKLSKLPTFLSMRIMTFSSGKDEGKILLKGVGLSKTKCFVRAPTTSAR
jgi:hypothetical protein